MQKAPLGIFKSKQSSDSSSKSKNRQQQQQQQGYHRPHASESPLKSPVAEVSSPGGLLEEASSPITLNYTAQSFDRSDYAVDQGDEQGQQELAPYEARSTQQQQQQQQRQHIEGTRETQYAAQRSPPVAGIVSRGANPLTSSPEQRDTGSYQSSTIKSTKSDSKKKKRFWDSFGLGLSSSSAASNQATTSTHSGSAPSANLPTPAAPHPKVLTKRRPQEQQQKKNQHQHQQQGQPDSIPTSPLSEQGQATPEQAFAIRSRQRHSVIGLPLETAFREGSVSSRDDLSLNSKIHREQTFNTASSHPQAERAPAWERLGTRTTHQRTASTDESYAIQSAGTSAQKSRLEPNYSDQHFTNSRPPSRQSIDPPSPSETSFTLSHQRTTSSQNSSLTKGYMGSQNNQQQPGGRNVEGQPNPTTREGQYGSTLSVNNQQPNSYRNTPQASPMVQENSNSGQGRSTPPPSSSGSKSREDLGQLDVQQLLSRHEELNDKYRKVKKYYFDKDAQVQQLQNSLAHQRLSQSKTSLDDNEYASRFQRLDGAINNLAFNIRKDWKAVPLWLAPCVNKDAPTAVTKEMTAVGRACISRWLVDEVFDRYFHPGLEPHLSGQLKQIEKTLRRSAPPNQAEEERETLLAKISNWRLATLDGLADVLNSADSAEYRAVLTKLLVDMLTQDLKDNLKEPAPSGLDAGVIGIIELAISIATNLPLESRDVNVDYIMPGTAVNDSYMKVEAALPALTNPGDGPPDMDRQSLGSVDDREEDDQKEAQGGKKKGVLGNLMGSNRKVGSRGNDSQSSALKEDRVRFAAFMSVEVKGKNMLVKAPVYV